MTERVRETDEWKLHAEIEWRAKDLFVECKSCHGEGTVGGGFKSIDGPRACSDCYGSGKVRTRASSAAPDVDPALVEHMRRAWWDYFNPPVALETVTIVCANGDNGTADKAATLMMQVTETGKENLRTLLKHFQEHPDLLEVAYIEESK